ncbi:ROK family transcriptional regulator [Acidothermaceae bacterium B102]|nr:ROK family transcriptional regulator [Acidothermaceae bacterium B102]
MAKARTTNVRDLRKINRSRALVEMYLHGPMTRLEIATAAGVSPATVSNLVSELLDQGVLIEVGIEDSDGGRPRVLLSVNPAYGYVVGVDVGETGTLVELFDLGMQPLASHAMSLSSDVLVPAESVDQVLEGLATVIKRSGVDEQSILGVGVGVPGMVAHGDDAVVDAQTVGWEAVPLGRLLRRGTSLPLLVDNGAKTLGQAEKWFGAARNVDNAIIVLLGAGVGTSIITDGELYRGSSSSAGEWGHTTMAVNGKTCRCGASGCLEAYVGARAMLARYAELAGTADDAGSSDDIIGRLEHVISAGATGSDRAAVALLEETASYLGAGLADLVNLFNPQRIVIGGWLGKMLTDRLLGAIVEAASKHALRLPYSQVSIVPAELGTDAVALGAATLPISQFLAAGAVPARAPQRRGARTGPSG